MNIQHQNIHQKEHTFLVLDGLRGVAAIAVMLYHYTGFIKGPDKTWLPNAFLSVDFFFVLSGFIIAHAYEKRLLSGQAVGEFLQRRLIRLYPLYWLGITFSAAWLIVKIMIRGQDPASSASLLSYFYSFFFLPAPASMQPPEGNLFPLDGPAWSLSLELAANLFYAMICIRLTKSRLAGLMLLGFLALLREVLLFHGGSMGWSWSTYLGGMSRVTWSFFAGIFLYRFYRQREHIKLPAWLGVLLAFILAADFACWHVGRIYSLSNCVILFPLIVWAGAQVAVWEHVRRLYVWLGQTSYALYILHMPLLYPFLFFAKALHINPVDHILPIVGCCALLALLIAWAADVIYDTPVRAYLNKKLFSRSVPHELSANIT